MVQESFPILSVADLGVEMRVVGNVVAMGAARRGTQEWRGVERADTEILQIGNDGARIGKGKSRIELDAVGGRRRVLEGGI